MMSPDNKLGNKSAGSKEESQTSAGGGRKTTPARPQAEQALRCPRCDSPNTKFCYYNNYSLTQPRHFCKTCRRYWTKGGALRNVPIGGGCRKNKKMKSSSSRLSGDSKDSSGASTTDIGGLKFFHGLSPAMDFQFGGLSFPKLHHQTSTTGVLNQFIPPFNDISTSSTTAIASSPCFNLDPSSGGGSGSLLGFNFPLSSMFKQGEHGSTATQAFDGGVQEMGSSSVNVHTSLASSIESLSSINQDLHWKLQQQRLAMLYGGQNQKDHTNNVASVVPIETQIHEKPQPILFQNLEISKPVDACGGIFNSKKEGATGSLATEWFFDNSNYASADPTPANSSGNANENPNNWNGFQAWSHLNQYTSLP